MNVFFKQVCETFSANMFFSLSLILTNRLSCTISGNRGQTASVSLSNLNRRGESAHPPCSCSWGHSLETGTRSEPAHLPPRMRLRVGTAVGSRMSALEDLTTQTLNLITIHYNVQLLILNVWKPSQPMGYIN